MVDGPERPDRGAWVGGATDEERRERTEARGGKTGPVPEAEVVVRTSRSGGPGGQHANTADTRVEAVWSASESAALSDWQRHRILERLGPVVRAVAEDTRSQARNRGLALGRLQAKVAAALVVVPPRRATRPSRAAIERRLAHKRRQAARKKQRRAADDDDD